MVDEKDKALRTSTLLHDLKGPVQNAKQFTLEISNTISSLQAIIASNPNGMDAKQIELAKELMSEDFQPCLKYLSESIALLEARIADYENT